MKPKFFSLIILCAITLTGMTLNVCAQVVAPGQQTNGSRANTIITAVPFLLITPDARAGAMGEAGVAVLPDVNTMSINPSKLAFLEHPYGFSATYSPWLANLNANINLAYLSGFYKIDATNIVGASLRYFSIGEIQLLDANNQDLGTYSPSEFAIDGTFARKFGDFFSLGTGVRYIHSGLASGQFSSGQNTKPGNALAVDVSAYVKKPTVFFGTDALFAFGICIANIGSKMSYTNAGNKYFLPTNLKLGTAATFMVADLHEFTLALDFNKLLVPTQPEYNENGEILKGRDPNVSVPEGIFGSFNDAPNGFSEELKEVSISAGAEYRFKRQFAARVGYFYESPQKGDRNYFTVGGGVGYEMFDIDLAYLIANSETSPLASTFRFTLMWNFDRAGYKSR